MSRKISRKITQTQTGPTNETTSRTIYTRRRQVRDLSHQRCYISEVNARTEHQTNMQSLPCMTTTVHVSDLSEVPLYLARSLISLEEACCNPSTGRNSWTALSIFRNSLTHTQRFKTQ